MIFESHAHYDDRQFDVDREDLLRVLPSKNVGIVVNVGADMESSASSVALAQSYDYIYAAVGVHPDEVESMDAACIDRLRQMAQDPRVLAIGEIGLDYFRKEGHACKDTQKYWFRQQLDLAVELEKACMEEIVDVLGIKPETTDTSNTDNASTEQKDDTTSATTEASSNTTKNKKSTSSSTTKSKKNTKGAAN